MKDKDKTTRDRDHDPLAWRLADILKRLNYGEPLDPAELAADYRVHRRTIQRDLHERFAFLPIKQVKGRYVMDEAVLGRLSFRDIERFAALAGLKGLFPSLDTQFFRELFDSRLQETVSIHGQSYEDLRHRLTDFRTVQRAIQEKHRLRFTYQKEEGSKQVEVEPYSLVNNAGVWYLAAVDAGRPKAYAFGKIKAPLLQGACFTLDPKIVRMLEAEDSIWLNTKKTEVVLTIAPPAAPYFRRRQLIAKQVIEKELENGGLIVSGKFAHPNQILPIVRYWLPNVRIISPPHWQDELAAGLQAYVEHKNNA